MALRRVRPLLALLATVLVVTGGPAIGSAGPATAAPGAGSGNGWRVDVASASGTGPGARVSYRLDQPLPVTDAQPMILVDGVSAGPVTVSADRRTVRLVGTVAGTPSPDDLDLVLSGRLLDEGGAPLDPGASGTTAAVPDPPTPGPLLGTDPAAPGPYAVATDDYDLDPIEADGLPDLETVGHVVAPTDAPGPRPVVLFLHGRHIGCYVPSTGHTPFKWPCPGNSIPVPSQDGYDYVQQVLASQGFITVSIAANGINVEDEANFDGGAEARAQLIEHHLALLAGGDLDDYLPAGAQPDLSQTVLVGHSRGGEGVNRATESDAPGGDFDVVGQVLLGPTDFSFQGTPGVPSVTVLPYCDGDVSDLQGQLFTDVPRDLVSDDEALHSTVLVMGANHNYFNTEWTPGLSQAPSSDDNGEDRGYCAAGRATRLTPDRQQDVGTAYIAAAAQLFTGDTALAPLFDGTGARAPTTQDLDIRTHATGGGRDVARAGAGSTIVFGADPATATLCSGRTTSCEKGLKPQFTSAHFTPDYAPKVPKRKAVRIEWTASGQEAGLEFASPLTFTGRSYVDLRVLLRPGDPEAAFDVRLTDGDGNQALVTPDDDGRVAALPTRQHGATGVAQTLRVDLDDVPGDVDLDDVTTVSLVSRTDEGRAWLLDVTGVPGTLPGQDVPHTPSIDVGPVKVREGNRTGVVKIPYTLDSPIGSEGARVRVVSYAGPGNALGTDPVQVSLPPGAPTEGVLEVPLHGDRVHERKRTKIPFVVYPLFGVAAADSDDTVVVVDDDPR